MKLKRKIAVIMLIMCTFILHSCAGPNGTGSGSGEGNSSGSGSNGKNPLVTIRMKDGGVIKVELYPDKAPNTVNNFISLIKAKFYNGLTFHRIVAEFMIQGGDPNGDGTGGPGYTIKGEFPNNGFKQNDLKHEVGVISMARRSQPLDSAGSQFFIMAGDAPHLDGSYAAFGKIVEGEEVIDEIVSVKTGANDKPVEDQIIEEITIAEAKED